MPNIREKLTIRSRIFILFLLAIITSIIFLYRSNTPTDNQSLALADTLESRALSPGITYTVLKKYSPLQVVRILQVDLHDTTSHIQLGLPVSNGVSMNGITDSVSRIAKSYRNNQHKVVAAINGGLFNTNNGMPEGLVVRNSEIVSIPNSTRPKYFFYTNKQGRADISHFSFNGSLNTNHGLSLPVEIVNHFYKRYQTALLNHYYNPNDSVYSDAYAILHPVDCYKVDAPVKMIVDSVARGNFSGKIKGPKSVIVTRRKMTDKLLTGISKGDTLSLNLNLLNTKPEIVESIEGWPTIAIDGKNVIKNGTSGFKYSWLFADLPMSRTALGISKDERFVYLVTVDGPSDWNFSMAFAQFFKWLGLYQSGSGWGMSLSALSDFMLRLGAYDVINLDGGKSTTMVVNGEVVSNPSQSHPERKVSSAILVTENIKK